MAAWPGARRASEGPHDTLPLLRLPGVQHPAEVVEGLQGGPHGPPPAGKGAGRALKDPADEGAAAEGRCSAA